MQNLLQWWNLLFLVPLLLAVALLLVGGLGGIGEGDSAGEATEYTTGVGAADGAHDVASGAEGGDSEGHDSLSEEATGENSGENPLTEGLRWVGIGVVPFTLLFAAFCLFFGFCGLMANQMLGVAESPEGRIWWAMGVATIGGVAGMMVSGALARRYMPQDAPPATGNKDLIGRVGRVVFTVTPEEGTVQVRDASGTLHQIAACVPVNHPTLEAGRSVLIISFDATRGIFIVNEDPTEDLG